MARQHAPMMETTETAGAERELPAGSELMIAFTLGMTGWWIIVQAVRWIAF